MPARSTDDNTPTTSSLSGPESLDVGAAARPSSPRSGRTIRPHRPQHDPGVSGADAGAHSGAHAGAHLGASQGATATADLGATVDPPSRPEPGGLPNSPGLSLRASPSFVVTDAVADITRRALTYLEVGYPVHLAGPAGTGKTTLAFHIAAQMGRPVSLIHGNDEFGSSDLVGRDAGYRKSTVVDNYIHSVLKTEEKLNIHWVNNRLTTACEQGHVLIYDEFNRTPPEANNTLLSILEERILNLPKLGGGDGYLRVHPGFRAIFTSNPEEYAGVHKTQDALLDRLVTIHVGHYDQRTEEDITSSKSGISRPEAGLIVEIARTLRQLSGGSRPTIRACIALARVLRHRGCAAHPQDPFFRAACKDVFSSELSVSGRGVSGLTHEQMDELIREVHSIRASRPPRDMSDARRTQP